MTNYGLNYVGVAGQAIHLSLSPHVPQSDSGVSTTRGKQVERGMECQGKHATQMAMVLTHHFVLLQIPTFHLLIDRAWYSIFHNNMMGLAKKCWGRLSCAQAKWGQEVAIAL